MKLLTLFLSLPITALMISKASAEPSNNSIAQLLLKAGATAETSVDFVKVTVKNLHCQKPLMAPVAFARCSMSDRNSVALAGLTGTQAAQLFELLAPQVTFNRTVDLPNFDVAELVCGHAVTGPVMCNVRQ